MLEKMASQDGSESTEKDQDIAFIDRIGYSPLEAINTKLNKKDKE
jgi:hypothetical protein